MTQNRFVEELQKLYLFEWLDSSSLLEVIKKWQIKNLKSDEIIIEQWADSDWKAYIILDWSVDVFIDWQKVAVIEKWSIFWEYALLSDEKRTATIKTNWIVTVLVIDRETIFTLADNDNKINKIITERIEQNMKNNLWIFKNN